MSSTAMALQDPGAVERATGGEDIVTYARWVVESGLFGKGITQAQAGLKMLVGRELGIAPLAAVRHIYIFEAQGRPTIILDATLMGAMVRTSGRYDYEVRQHDEKGTVLEMFRLGPGDARTSIGTASFTMADAARAGLDRKDGPWKQGYGRDMCFARAMSRLVDHYAPELLLGLSMPVVTPEQAGAMPMGHDQRKAIFAALRRYDMADEERHRWASDVVGRPIASFAAGTPGGLTRHEAGLLIDWLREREEEAIGLAEPVQAEIVSVPVAAESEGDPSPDVRPAGARPPAVAAAGTPLFPGQGRRSDDAGADTPHPGSLSGALRASEQTPARDPVGAGGRADGGSGRDGEVEAAPAASATEDPTPWLTRLLEILDRWPDGVVKRGWVKSMTENFGIEAPEMCNEELAERAVEWADVMGHR